MTPPARTASTNRLTAGAAGSWSVSYSVYCRAPSDGRAQNEGKLEEIKPAAMARDGSFGRHPVTWDDIVHVDRVGGLLVASPSPEIDPLSRVTLQWATRRVRQMGLMRVAAIVSRLRTCVCSQGGQWHGASASGGDATALRGRRARGARISTLTTQLSCLGLRCTAPEFTLRHKTESINERAGKPRAALRGEISQRHQVEEVARHTRRWRGRAVVGRC